MPSAPLRVLLNACTMPENPTGIWLYGLELGTALAARDDCEVVFASPKLCPQSAELLVPPTRLKPGNKHGAAARLQLWTEFELPRLLRRQRCDVYHGVHFKIGRAHV